MSQEKRFSDEFLNAFVDNQIAAEEKSRAYLEIQRDEGLNRQVCELRKLHDLVQLAYLEPPAPPVQAVTGPNAGRARLRFGVAASILLTLGIVLGNQIRLPEPATTTQAILAPATETPRVVTTALPTQAATTNRPSSTDVTVGSNLAQTPPPATAENLQPASKKTTDVVPAYVALSASRNKILNDAQTKVLIHLARDDVAQLSQALDEIEGVLKHYRAIRLDAHVEVVVNGKGLELVRTDTSAFAERIQRLQRDYDNLTFAACQNTIDRLARDQGIIVRLLPGVITIDSGMAEILRRQSQGWAYIQV